MPRSLWKGAVSFGLVTIPVALYGATEEKDVRFHQVHAADGGRIKLRRICEVCGEEVPYAAVAKGYQAPDGRVVVLEASDLEHLPLATTRQIEIVQFVEASEVDPTYLERAYFIAAEGPGAKPYALLRDALRGSGRVALVKVALRSRESLGLLRAHGEVLMLHTMLWPDELRDGAFAAPDAQVRASEAEVAMARMFIDQLSGPFEPGAYADHYREALEQVVAAKLEGVPAPEAPVEEPSGQVVDLVAALKASVDAARRRRAAGASHEATGGEGQAAGAQSQAG